ncbi:tRNA(Ile)-lysidine synthetase [Desulfitobacterium dichloroeliminans LMG P-21439]|uniref:tRNA(Ile)-lysidine synthase n=1 Tax=Desulfitobacterium dichloroeliminans (strain LMG P-21439 / DCA1) TaxID=871963 RepID=L0F1D3_DESDL|nr:tRNA lysidine(34) synthetase TilS [Desulfitobacterium dichloroeliminans]AGA67649.1 tRNA(Ile)-lysidine synthetase [Desulfitobacterium dichloroeliminans LMG P-21439]
MYEKLKQHVLHKQIPPGSRILVAVSGGPDSMALAHILWRFMKENQHQEISLVLTHVHHGVRKESDEEEKMVTRMARDWKIPCLIHRFDSKGYAKSVGKSFQTAAREWRYARWEEDLQQENCSLLATAHHLGDQAETVLYRLLRGSGSAGLAGIYPQKGKLIRPLLGVAKEEILQYCRSENLPYAIDCSNADPIYTRNKIRLELLPELQREYNPQIMVTLGRMAELLRWDEEYLEEKTEEAWQEVALESTEQRVVLHVKAFELPKAILSRLIRKAVSRVSGEPRGIGYSYVDRIIASLGQVGWSQDLPGLKIVVNYQGVCFLSVGLGQDIGISKNELDLSPLPQEVHWGEWLYWQDAQGQMWQAGLFNLESQGDWLEFKNKSVDQVFFDLYTLKNHYAELQWRRRQEGDCLWIAGVGHKSLKKVFQDAKISASHRQAIPLLALDDEILWIPGVKGGERFRGQQEGAVGLLMKCLEDSCG